MNQNANLDPLGEKSLQQMVTRLKQQGTSFIIISHLQHIISVADYLMVMMHGQAVRFGKPAEVVASMQAPAIKTAPETASCMKLNQTSSFAVLLAPFKKEVAYVAGAEFNYKLAHAGAHHLYVATV